MFDRVIASASLALSNLPDDNDDGTPFSARRDSMAEDTAADLMPQPDPSRSEAPQSLGPQDAADTRHAAAQIAQGDAEAARPSTPSAAAGRGTSL